MNPNAYSHHPSSVSYYTHQPQYSRHHSQHPCTNFNTPSKYISMSRGDSYSTNTSSGSSLSSGSRHSSNSPGASPRNECYGPLGDKSRSSSATSQHAAYVCLSHNCDYSAKRAYDLNRHSEALHSRPDKLLDCPYKGCGHRGEHGFKRKDHLRDHSRRVHLKELPGESSQSRTR